MIFTKGAKLLLLECTRRSSSRLCPATALDPCGWAPLEHNDGADARKCVTSRRTSLDGKFSEPAPRTWHYMETWLDPGTS